MIPDRDTCLQLLEKAGCSPQVVEHVQAVEALACELTKYAPESSHAIVQAGALLHDVGRSLDHGPQHVPLGVAFLREQDVGPPVLRCVARHMGAGLTDQEARDLGWPLGEGYMPESIDERIVCHADNLTAGTDYVTLDQVLEKLERQGLDHVLDRMRRLHDGLSQELGVDPAQVAGELGSRG